MALLKTATLGDRLAEDIDLDASVEQIASADISRIYALRVNNQDNTSTSYVRLWDASSTPAVGTDDPDWILPVPAGEIKTFTFGAGLAGVAISNDLFLAAVTEKGKTGSTSPTNNVKGELIYDA